MLPLGAELDTRVPRPGPLTGGQNPETSERLGAEVLCDRLGELLGRAQEAGAIRADVTLDDIEALMVACMSRPDGLEPILATVTDGLRTR